MPTNDLESRATWSRVIFKTPAFLEDTIIRVTKISGKTLDNLIGRGLIALSAGAPPGRGARRLYSAFDAVVLAVIQQQLDLGLAPQRAVKIAEKAGCWIAQDEQVIHFLATNMRTLPAARLVITPDAEEGRIESPPRAVTPAAAITLDLSGLIRNVIEMVYRK